MVNLTSHFSIELRQDRVAEMMGQLRRVLSSTWQRCTVSLSFLALGGG